MHRYTRRAILGSLAAAGPIRARSSHEVLESVMAMEARDSLTVFTVDGVPRDWLGYSPEMDGSMVSSASVSPDGCSILWSKYRFFHGRSEYTLMLSDVKTGSHEVRFNKVPSNGHFVIASGMSVFLADTFLEREQRLVVYAVDLQTGEVLRDLTPAVRQFDLRSLQMSVSGLGTRAALGSLDHFVVLDIASGRTIYEDSAWFPRLSPDGKRVAYVRGERLYIRSLDDETTTTFLPHARVKGAGGWSPNGRFLLAGAWTRRLTLEKRQIVVDTIGGEYGEIGTLGDGDYGNQLTWISTKLLVR